ncbi:hypothetical protein PYCC9005_000797 [Savitreella phatthalungensis]
MADFHRKSYWEQRFDREQAFDWLVSSEQIFLSVKHLLQPQSRVLHLGSGTSNLHVCLRHDGHLDVRNVDFAQKALDHGRQMELLEFGDVLHHYSQADVTRLPANWTGTVDVVIDKSTADAVSCAGDDAVLAMAREVSRVLSSQGIWICCSYSCSRFDLSDELPFSVMTLKKFQLPKSEPNEPDIFHYCYLLNPKR